jgi:hypothetical protein
VSALAAAADASSSPNVNPNDAIVFIVLPPLYGRSPDALVVARHCRSKKQTLASVASNGRVCANAAPHERRKALSTGKKKITSGAKLTRSNRATVVAQFKP